MANQPKKYKKFVATAATATLVASAIVPVASAASLSDIAGNTHEAAITSLVDAGIINGYADGTFKPNKTLTRSDVVKLLGKYLVSEGYSIPSDAVTSPRFSDLTSKSNKELLEYAAVVADAGVFAGSNGKLLAGDPITRENMAIVLVRMVNTLKDVSLEEFVGSQKFDREVKDINAAKAEARTAIDVLDYFDITTATNFLPKNSVTRGQFATFLNNVIKADFTGVGVTSSTVKAINATTVEVTFGEDVADIKALDFAIKGLDISNAVVKQTDKKTVVLTTSAQTAGVEYTVTVNGNDVGKFTGVSAVIPTKVEFVSSSVQGKLGQQVSVQAKVTVAEGQSKAGIPVTFSIPGNNNDAVYPTVTGEAFTNADGVATYTYTRYGKGTDAVTAYATGDRSKFAIGYVFWGVDTILAITEVTEGATINNGANKTYKITYKDPETGKPVSGQTFNVGFIENMNVTSDKVANATVNGVKALQLSNGTALNAATITTDSKGEATFTVSGTNTAVTPVVYALNNTTGGENSKTYKASALQTSAAKVTFGAVQAEYKIELTREGGEVAAIGASNGRVYKVVVKDKDGKVAKNEVVNVAFNEDLDRVISTNTDAEFIKNKAYVGKTTTVKTDDKGEATFVIGSNTVNAYATPIAWIDINTSNAKDGQLDEGEPKAVAPISYFQEAYLDGASVKSYVKNTDYTNDDNVVTKFKGNETAVFRAQLVNQSGKTLLPERQIKTVTYTIYNTGANEVKVDNQVISPNRSYTVTYVSGSHNLEVVSIDNKTTSVKVIATGIAINTDGKDYAFTAKDAEATFTSTTAVGKEITEHVVAVSKTHLEFAGKDPISLKDAKFFGGNGSDLIGVDAFIAELTSYPNGVIVTYLEDAEGKKTFKVVRATNAGKVNTVDTLKTAKITQSPSTGTTADVATVTLSSSAILGQSFTVNGQTFTYNAGASASDVNVFASATDLISKINAKHGVVTATADVAGITLIGKADGSSFEYRIGSLTPVTVTGTGAVGAITKQEVTFTFGTAVNLSAGALVTVNGSVGTVEKVEGTEVVVSFVTPLTLATSVTTFTVGSSNPLKAKTSGEVVNLNSVTIQ